MKFHENEKDQPVRLATENQRVLSLLHTKYSNIKEQKNSKFSTCYYNIQDIKYVKKCRHILGL